MTPLLRLHGLALKPPLHRLDGLRHINSSRLVDWYIDHVGEEWK